DIEGRKQGRRSMPFITMAEAVHSFAVGQAKIALSPLQRLDMGLLVNTDNHRVLRRIQIEPDHVGGLRTELRVRRDAPTAPPLKLNAAPTQNSPYLVFAYVAQRLCQQFSIPLRKTFRRRFVEHLQHTLFRAFAVFVGLA